MKVFLGFLAVLLVSVGAIPNPPKIQHGGSTRIIGGQQVSIEANPWQVSLQFLGLHNCGGSIISENVILTAGHCIDGLLSLFYEVVAGTAILSEGGVRIAAAESIVHPDYDPNTSSNDVAIIRLSESLVFSDTIQAIPLSTEDPLAGTIVSVSGWGVTSEGGLFTPNELYAVNTTVVDRDECATDYRPYVVDDTMVCAGEVNGGKDACQGDSGGPLVQDGKIVGIVSWGVGCAEVGYPGVYTNVAAVQDWIRQEAGL